MVFEIFHALKRVATALIYRIGQTFFLVFLSAAPFRYLLAVFALYLFQTLSYVLLKVLR